MRRASNKIAISAALLFLLTAALGAQGPSARLIGFEPIGDYLLEVDGAAVPAARIYASRSAGAILVMTSKLPSPVLIRPRSLEVAQLNLMKIEEQPNGSIDLLPDPVLAAEDPFKVDGTQVSFRVGERRATLKPKPPLVGLHPAASLESHSPEYARRADAYQPNDSVLQQLRSQTRPVRIRVFFGTWCPACGQLVPRIIKVGEQLGESRVEVEYYGLPRQFGDDPEAKRYGIKSVPTGVVFLEGREVGRLSGNDWRIPELAISNLLGS